MFNTKQHIAHSIALKARLERQHYHTTVAPLAHALAIFEAPCTPVWLINQHN